MRARIGERVIVSLDGEHHHATVVRHGRDSAGVYTEIRYGDGSTECVHRSCVRAVGVARHGKRHVYFFSTRPGDAHKPDVCGACDMERDGRRWRYPGGEWSTASFPPCDKLRRSPDAGAT